MIQVGEARGAPLPRSPGNRPGWSSAGGAGGEWPYPEGAGFIVVRDPDGNERLVAAVAEWLVQDRW